MVIGKLKIDDIKKVKLEQGDILVIKTPVALSNDDCKYLSEVISQYVGFEVMVLGLDPGSSIQVVKSAKS